MIQHYYNTSGPSYVSGKGWRVAPPRLAEGGGRNWDTATHIWRVQAATEFAAIEKFNLGDSLPGGSAMYLQARAATYVGGNAWDVTLEYQGLHDLSVPESYEFTAVIRDRAFTRAEIFPNQISQEWWTGFGPRPVGALRLSSLQVGGTLTFFSRFPLPTSIQGMQNLIRDGVWNPAPDNWDLIRNNPELLVAILPNGKVPRSAGSEKLVYGQPLFKHAISYLNEREIDIT